MVTEIIMPKLGDTMEKGKIVKWLKKDCEKVEKGEPLLEIETEKTTIEVESRGSGTLKILVPEGEERPINTLIGYILREGETLPVEAVPEPHVVLAEAAQRQFAESTKVEEPKAEAATRIKASPLAKKIAEEKGVDLTRVVGTGPGGRITQEDVLNYLARKPAVERVEVTAEQFQTIPLSSMRRAIARKMSESKAHVPHFYVSTLVDMTEAAKLRENLISLVEAKSGVRLSFTHLLIKTVAMALQEFPQVNSTFEAENIKQWKEINIGIAVNLEDGLIVPVLKGANKLSIFEIASQTDKLVERAKAKKLREDEFSGGTFTISNMGTLDVESFVPIINIPETAILGVGKISDRPSVVNGQITIRKMMTITLSADHRVIDGVLAARFLQRIKKLLETPYNLILSP